MISRSDVESLIEREPKPGSPVLSVYLNVIPSRLDPVNRAFEVVLKNLLREIESGLDKKAREEFQEDTEPVFTFLEDYREPKRGLVFFCDQSENFFWFKELRVGVPDVAWWRDTPYVRPLIEVMSARSKSTMMPLPNWMCNTSRRRALTICGRK